jgi:hypothetical protein
MCQVDNARLDYGHALHHNLHHLCNHPQQIMIVACLPHGTVAMVAGRMSGSTTNRHADPLAATSLSPLQPIAFHSLASGKQSRAELSTCGTCLSLVQRRQEHQPSGSFCAQSLPSSPAGHSTAATAQHHSSSSSNNRSAMLFGARTRVLPH